MPGRGSQTFKKRQKEQQRKEKQQEKMAQRLARKDNPPASPSDDENLTEVAAQPGAEGAEGERRAEENGLNRALRDL
jgi:RNase H-fold protein (predicted Holliday junction resolvase)